MTRYSILLIEADSVILRKTGRLLQENGYVVTSAIDISTALNNLKETRFDIIITNHITNKKNGARIRDHIKTVMAETYILLLTDANSIETNLPFLRPEYDDYLLNPFKPEELLFRISHFTQKMELQKKQLNQKTILAENIEHFRTLFNHSSDYILVLDVESERGPTLINANDIACRSYGYTRDEFIGMPYSVIDPERSLDNFKAIIRNLREGNLQAIDMEHTRKDGSTLPVEVSAILVKINGNPLIYLIESDLSKRRRREEEQLNVTKLESIGILAGGFAHDFNNLFSIICGNIELAKHSAVYDDDPVINLKKAENAIKQAQDLTQLLTSYSKGSGLTIARESVKELIQDSIKLVPQLPGISIKTVIPDNIGAVDMDITQMRRALGNIILNAMESMPTGGLIRISAEHLNTMTELDDTGLGKGHYIKISITDEGRGIPDEYIPLIFDPYFSTKERGTQKGMGMGLAISYSIIKRHMGELKNQPGTEKGTTFVIVIPRTRKE